MIHNTKCRLPATTTSKQVKFLSHCSRQYREELLEDTIPFWFPRCIDQEYGGYFTGLDRRGRVVHPDKSLWFQGRGAWTLCNVYNHVEKRPEYLEYAKNGLNFIDRYGFDENGKMFFSVTRDGKPLRQRRYWFSESFAVIAFAAYAKASGDSTYLKKAEALFEKILFYYNTPGALPPKVNPDVRPSKGSSQRIILLSTAQELRGSGSTKDYQPLIDSLLKEIQEDFYKPEFHCVLEEVGPQGEFIDTFEGRVINPGHSMELGWFVLYEAMHRNHDPKLIDFGTRIIEDAFHWGWDKDHGGIFYFRDCKNLPCWEYWSDMKFWWPHNESIIATLLAWLLSEEPHFFEKHESVHHWAYSHFPDREAGEWFGYLHRDGTVSTELKGTMWKGPFHLPRMQWFCWQILHEALG